MENNNRKDTKTEKLFLIVILIVFVLLLTLAEKPKKNQKTIMGKSKIYSIEKDEK